ncbi:MAG TPA: SDR family oxidoreductase [Candidatus Peribacterales bacterium]|nr:SDR family oxidoreductase [Candidatus Peribacterales bacterium]
MKRILITGASGLLGGNLLLGLPKDWEIVGITHTFPLREDSNRTILQADLEREDIAVLCKPCEPFDAIIHTAALTNVDTCEKEKEKAMHLNARIPEKLAQYAHASGAHLIHISTDQVFDGKKGHYTEESLMNPVNHYGKTKMEGEDCVRKSGCMSTIIRTNLFGFNVQEKHDFAGWILNSLQVGKELELFEDVRFSIILANDLVDAIADIIERRLTGTLHIGSVDQCSKYEFGLRLAETFELSTNDIRAASVDDVGLTARRPHDMTMDVSLASKSLKNPLPTIDRCIAKYKELADNGFSSLLRSLRP